MPHSAIIDLLSSDDEKPLRRSTSPKTKGEYKRREEAESLFLEDDFDSTINFDDSWTASGSKRRKLSPSPELETDTYQPRYVIGRQGGPSLEATEALPRRILTKQFNSFDFTQQDRSSSPWRGFSSSPIGVANDGSDDDSFPQGILRDTCRQVKQSGLSARTATLLASLEQPVKRKKARGEGKSAEKRVVRHSRERPVGLGDENTEIELSKTPKRVRKSRLTDEEKAAREHEKEARKAERAREREDAKATIKERKAREKEVKVREKQKEAALAEVNKSRLDKKITGPEMIVDLPASINGQAVDTQIREHLKHLEIEATSYQSALPNVIRWRRKVKSRYNKEKEHWEPLGRMEIDDEKHVICIMSAEEFVALASANRNSPDVETHVLNLKTNFDDYKVIYLIEGLTPWMRKNSTTLNRAYQAAVRSQMDDDQNSAPAPAPRRRKPAHEHVDPDMIEDALLRLQVVNGCLIYHTAIPSETAEWVANFTQHISTIPSRYLYFPLFPLLLPSRALPPPFH